MPNYMDELLLDSADVPADLREFFEPAECAGCYICHMVQVFAEVRRVLRKDGTCWINIGDSYAGSGKGPGNTFGGSSEQQTKRQGFVGKGGWQDSRGFRGNGHHRNNGYAPAPEGLKPKDLCGVPWRVAFALQDDGWWLRSDTIWSKPNPMPESVTDRPTRSHEYLFLLTKARQYYYDADALAAEDGRRAPRGQERLSGRTPEPAAHPERLAVWRWGP